MSDLPEQNPSWEALGRLRSSAWLFGIGGLLIVAAASTYWALTGVPSETAQTILEASVSVGAIFVLSGLVVGATERKFRPN